MKTALLFIVLLATIVLGYGQLAHALTCTSTTIGNTTYTNCY